MSQFQEQVLDKSFAKPVIVDFWAPWCGPCRVLGPVIEQLAEEQADLWNLVKINTEEEQELAMQYQIRSIPNVKMFYRGEVIAEFLGALPKPAIEKWLKEHLPDDRTDDLSEILQAFEANPDDTAALEHFVAKNPDMVQARLELSKAKLFSDSNLALELIKDIKLGDELFQEAESIKAVAQFLNNEFDRENQVGSLLVDAKEALKTQNFELSIQKVIEATTIDKGYLDDTPRKTAIGLFQYLGPKHPLTKQYRWKFDMVLY